MSLIADVFPVLVILSSIALLLTIRRLNKRVSRGATNAGPAERVQLSPPGLRLTPWELSIIDDQLLAAGTVTQDLVNTINRLQDASGITPIRPFSYPATTTEVAQAVYQLEQYLELRPLDPNELN